MRRLALVVPAVLLLCGCAAPLLIGGAAATGMVVATDRRTAGTMLDDERIELQVLGQVAKDAELTEGSHLNVTSYNGIVLLTGEVGEEALGRRIIDIATREEKVREVKNELRIAPPTTAASRSRDTLITTRVKSRLVAEPTVDGNTIKVVSENGTVYLMGLVTLNEAEDAVEVTRGTEGVQRIVKVFEYIQ